MQPDGSAENEAATTDEFVVSDGFTAPTNHRENWKWAVPLLKVLSSPMGAFGMATLIIMTLIALFAPHIAPYDPLQQHADSVLVGPSYKFLLGTDHLGRDILSRIIFGSRASLSVGVLAVTIGAFFGVLTGLLAGYFGGLTDTIISRVYDVILAFPGILLAIGTVAVLGPGVYNIAIAIAIAQIPNEGRLARSIVLSLRERDYVLAARALGASKARRMFIHILPNVIPLMLVQISLEMAGAVLSESSLSFLGLGIQPPSPSWGGMLNESRTYLRQAPLFGTMPGLALAILLVGLNFLSNAMRDALDPRVYSR